MKLYLLPRAIIIALYTAVVAGTWDAWWHGAVGRDSPFEPPHVLLYAATLTAVLLGAYGWYTTKEKVWKKIALVLLLIPASAPFDELWHRIFGVEDLSSPLIVWSPPHLAIIFALAASFIVVVPVLRRDTDPVARRLFSSMTFAGILSLLFFLIAPLQPTGPWELLGFWGAGVVVAVMVGVFIMHEGLFAGVGNVFSLIVFYLVATAISFGEVIKPGVKIVPHDHPPSFVIVFSCLLSAAVFDMSKKLPLWVRGGLVGLVWSGLYYGLSRYYFRPEFQYSIAQAIQAILVSCGGGVVIGLLTDPLKKRVTWFSEKLNKTYVRE